ncbi:O-methyltransferase [Clostridium aminobutyricum]|uniref:O-methyltransferase n=2 Tax=Clostridium aminobutyricum TaxID=33953 RepID=A0A939IGS9_CLOAM|nr:O-methyltransferase [Clostridium aminobutyricum]
MKNITNEKITEFIDGLYKPLTSELSELRVKSEEEHVPIILRETETLLLHLIRLKKPSRILEIGTAVGYSSSCFAQVCPACTIATIEYNEETYHTAIENIKRLGYDNQIKVYLGDGGEILDQFHEQGNAGFDMVFIDASKSHYRRFWDGAVKLCNDEALIVSDNILMKGMTVSEEYDYKGKHKTNIRNMRDYLAYILSLEYAKTSIIPSGDGLAISIISK